MPYNGKSLACRQITFPCQDEFIFPLQLAFGQILYFRDPVFFEFFPVHRQYSVFHVISFPLSGCWFRLLPDNHVHGSPSLQQHTGSAPVNHPVSYAPFPQIQPRWDFICGRRNRTSTLKVMGLANYHCSIPPKTPGFPGKMITEDNHR